VTSVVGDPTEDPVGIGPALADGRAREAGNIIRRLLVDSSVLLYLQPAYDFTRTRDEYASNRPYEPSILYLDPYDEYGHRYFCSNLTSAIYGDLIRDSGRIEATQNIVRTLDHPLLSLWRIGAETSNRQPRSVDAFIH
jgi:hypothetical protein